LNRRDRKEIRKRTAVYENPQDYFIDRLALGVGTIAAAFYPRPVIMRFSDFKTNEYAGLLGGAAFEPTESNPMLGFRGASRYYDDRYRDGFALECAAVRKVRDEMGLMNLKVMIPFCRTLKEGQLVLDEMAKHGLETYIARTSGESASKSGSCAKSPTTSSSPTASATSSTASPSARTT
jgi:pyruvate, water dikinase